MQKTVEEVLNELTVEWGLPPGTLVQACKKTTVLSRRCKAVNPLGRVETLELQVKQPAVAITIHGMSKKARLVVWLDSYKDRSGVAHPLPRVSSSGPLARRGEEDRAERVSIGRGTNPIRYLDEDDRRQGIHEDRLS